MQRILILIFSILCQMSFAQKQFIIDANVSHSKKGDIVFFYYYKNPTQVVADSAIIENGRFTIKGSVENPTLMNLYKKNDATTERNFYTFFFAEGNDKLYLDYSDFNQSTIHNKFQRDLIKYIAFKKDVNDNFTEIRQHNGEYDHEELNRLLKELEVKSLFRDIDFAKQNPSSFVALYYLFFDLGRSVGRKNFGGIKSAFETMDEPLKKSSLGAFITQKLNSLENMEVGRIAPTFSAQDITGSTFSLSDILSKKVIILDFWASWCAPCKMQLPFLKKINDEYKNRGLQIVSISEDKKKDAWENAVKKGEMDWINLIAAQESQGVLHKYAAQAIPILVLIDKKGQIVGRWSGYDEAYFNEIEKKIDDILD